MKSVSLCSVSLIALLLLCACPSQERAGYHKIAVTWSPGYENVPDCNPLIAMQGNTMSIKGVKVVTPVGVGVEGGEYTREQKALQTASDAAQQADQKYVRLCKMLPAYSNDKPGFYRVRDQMFDLIAGTTHVATVVAAQTGQAPPTATQPVPTAAADAAASAGVSATKGVANTPIMVGSAPPPIAEGPHKKNVDAVNAASAKLKNVARKKAPAKKTPAKAGNNPGAAESGQRHD